MNPNQDIDVSMILRNLELTPEKRIFEHKKALEILLEIEKAREKLKHGSQ